MTRMESRSNVVSSFTIVKGSLIDETHEVFRAWDFSVSKYENLRRAKEHQLLGAASEHWLRDVGKVLNRRFDPNGRDRALVELAQAGCDQTVWRPILLWHLTRDEFLVRDFLISWLYPHHVDGAYRVRPDDVVPYLEALPKRKGIRWAGEWSPKTTDRVASGLLRIAADFGLLRGGQVKEFSSYHLPDGAFLYLLHALAEGGENARRVIESPEWHMYLMDAADVERELLRLHQFRKLHYDVAGSLSRLELPFGSAAEYAQELAA